METQSELRFLISSEVSNDALNELFASAWKGHRYTDFSYLAASLGYVCCYLGDELVGFVNLAWDGNKHAFILDTTVAGSRQRRGIGQRLVAAAVELARSRNVEWVHVDFEPIYENFYRSCGFKPTQAGLLRVAEQPSS